MEVVFWGMVFALGVIVHVHSYLRNSESNYGKTRHFLNGCIVTTNVAWYLSIMNLYTQSIQRVLLCAFGSILLMISIVDFYTYRIPGIYILLIMILGCVQLTIDWQNKHLYLIGLISISSALLLIFVASKGSLMGGGDVKLMAACGLLLGWKLLFVAFFMGCICAIVIHTLRMKLSKENNILAMGPYLSLGIAISILRGSDLIDWYHAFF